MRPHRRESLRRVARAVFCVRDRATLPRDRVEAIEERRFGFVEGITGLDGANENAAIPLQLDVGAARPVIGLHRLQHAGGVVSLAVFIALLAASGRGGSDRRCSTRSSHSFPSRSASRIAEGWALSTTAPSMAMAMLRK